MWNISGLNVDNFLHKVKLYIFDKEKRNWTERGVLSLNQQYSKSTLYISGRGQLRLNDSAVSKPGHLKSRLVVRIPLLIPGVCCFKVTPFDRWEPLATWGLFWIQSFGLIWSAKRYNSFSYHMSPPSTIAVQANEKNIRISALDEGEVCLYWSKHFKIGQNSLQVKIFLIACSIKEAEKLYTALEYRSDIGYSDLIDRLSHPQNICQNGSW